MLGLYRKGAYHLTDKNCRKAYHSGGETELDKNIAVMEYEQEKVRVLTAKQKRRSEKELKLIDLNPDGSPKSAKKPDSTSITPSVNTSASTVNKKNNSVNTSTTTTTSKSVRSK
jgi:hypothetical protein